MSQENEFEFKILRLIRGEDLIGLVKAIPHVTGQDDYHYLIEHPMRINYYSSEEGLSMGLLPWFFQAISLSTIFKIYSRDVLTLAEPTVNLANMWNKTLSKLKQESVAGMNNVPDDHDSELFKEEAIREFSDNVSRVIH